MNQFAQIQQDWVQQRNTLEALGIIAVNGDGQVQFMSQRAWQWLNQYFQDKCSRRCLPENLQRWVISIPVAPSGDVNS